MDAMALGRKTVTRDYNVVFDGLDGVIKPAGKGWMTKRTATTHSTTFPMVCSTFRCIRILPTLWMDISYCLRRTEREDGT